ncbi:MAG: hypothetical protein WCJ99_15225, partial [Betaproteobacteria bacterium]
MSSFELESNNTIATANLLTSNTPMVGQASSSSDIDFFKLSDSGAGTANFTITVPNNYSYYTVKLYDNGGTLQQSYSLYNAIGTYSVPALSAGYSYISVSSSSTDSYSIKSSFVAS